MKHRSLRVLLGTIALAAALVGCSGEERSVEAFCDELARVTGPEGVEVRFASGDPARLDALIGELNGLHERAPDELSTTTLALVDFFSDYQRAPRDERRTLLADNERRIIDASATLEDYALNECGLLLQRAAPTVAPTPDPGVEIAPE